MSYLKSSILLLFLIILFHLTSCKYYQIQSTWSNNINIDGNPNDWEKFVYLKDIKSGLAIANDDSFIYISLKTNDRAIIRRILINGLTLWLKGDGLKSPKYGVKYPLGLERSEWQFNQRQFTTGGDFNNPRGRSKFDIHEIIERIKEEQTGIEIYGPGKDDVIILGLNNRERIKVSIGIYKGQFVYELQFPIFYDTDYSLKLKQGSPINLTLESKIQSPGIETRMGPGFYHPRGSFPGGQGEAGIPIPQRRAALRTKEPIFKDIKLRIRVKLAESN